MNQRENLRNVDHVVVARSRRRYRPLGNVDHLVIARSRRRYRPVLQPEKRWKRRNIDEQATGGFAMSKVEEAGQSSYPQSY